MDSCFELTPSEIFSKGNLAKFDQPRFVLESAPAGAQLLFDEHAVTGVPFAWPVDECVRS